MASCRLRILICFSYFVIFGDATEVGFSINLIHRDSPKSPFYNPKETSAQLLANAFRQSVNRARHFRRLMSRYKAVIPSDIEAETVNNHVSYTMQISVGTPAKLIHVTPDTGSDLIWTQCTPCNGCSKQADSLFDPNGSSTYKNLRCASRECRRLERHTCSSNGKCQYSYSYADQSFTNGSLGVEAITLNSTDGRPVSFPKIVFGCGHSNQMLGASGIVGLGGGPLSLVRQIGSSINGKFAYCLVPFNSETDRSSVIKFGSDANVLGRGVKSSPLILKPPGTFYLLILEAITIEIKRIDFPGSSSGLTEGNITIDSGTTLTSVPPDLFTDIASAVDNVVRGNVVDDPLDVLELCYTANSVCKVPQVTAHFKGADVKLDPSTILIHVSDDVVCLPIHSFESGAMVFGNLQQTNLLIGYDLVEKTVSFKSTDCTKI